MHASLAELLEHLNLGLLWVTRDGVVRFANGEAVQRTGLVAGRKLYDPDLMRAVAISVAGQVPRTATAAGSSPDGGSPLRCRVIPGLAQDDAFVLISADPRQDDGSGFDSLLQAIRSDLREPLQKAQTTLSEVAATEPEPAALDALLDDVSQVLSVVDKLVDLADLWNSGALLATDRVELWPLLQQVWAETEPLAMDRGVKVHFRARADAASLPTLYGSERWLKRVLQECLDAAVRGTRRGASLVIEHRQMGPRALIVFRKSGVFAMRSTAEAMDLSSSMHPGRPVPSPQLSAREQIGFKLCRHIVSLHGGYLREEMDDGVRNFIIDLPTGAPHHDAQQQLDIAQAQRYASDLAALMTHARQRTHGAPLAAIEPDADQALANARSAG